MSDQLTTERLRELAAGATIYVHERNAMAAELLAKREECEALAKELAEQRRHINRPQYEAMEQERDNANAALRRMANTHAAAIAERDAVTRHRDDLLYLYKRDCETMAATGIKETLLQDAIPALAAARDAARAEAKKYHDALVARHGGEPIALLSELDAARAEADAARRGIGVVDGLRVAAEQESRQARAEAEKLRADLQAMTVEAMRAGREANELRAELDAWRSLGTEGEPVADVVERLRHVMEEHAKLVSCNYEAELDAVKRQRDELLASAKLAIREIRPSTDCSMCHDSTWDHECDSKVNTTHVALSNAIKGAIAASQPAQQPNLSLPIYGIDHTGKVVKVVEAEQTSPQQPKPEVQP